MSTLQIDFTEAKPSEIDFGKPKSKIVGIDLGTTNSLVAVMELTGPRILSGIVPSVVSVKPSGEIVAGKEARERLITHPERSIYSVKRLMGRGREDVREELKLFPFHLAPNHGNDDGAVLRLQLGEVVMSPPEVSARTSCANSSRTRKRLWASRSRKPLSPSRPISTMRRGRRRRMPGALPASMFCVW